MVVSFLTWQSKHSKFLSFLFQVIVKQISCNKNTGVFVELEIDKLTCVSLRFTVIAACHSIDSMGHVMI